MRAKQPPAAANWLLRHLTLGEANEALAGDLLEEFQDGRSVGWYWSQVLVAVALSWLRESFARTSVLAFAILWSMLAPSWYVWTDKIQNDVAILHGLFPGLPF